MLLLNSFHAVLSKANFSIVCIFEPSFRRFCAVKIEIDRSTVYQQLCNFYIVHNHKTNWQLCRDCCSGICLYLSNKSITILNFGFLQLLYVGLSLINLQFYWFYLKNVLFFYIINNISEPKILASSEQSHCYNKFRRASILSFYSLYSKFLSNSK